MEQTVSPHVGLDINQHWLSERETPGSRLGPEKTEVAGRESASQIAIPACKREQAHCETKPTQTNQPPNSNNEMTVALGFRAAVIKSNLKAAVRFTAASMLFEGNFPTGSRSVACLDSTGAKVSHPGGKFDKGNFHQLLALRKQNRKLCSETTFQQHNDVFYIHTNCILPRQRPSTTTTSNRSAMAHFKNSDVCSVTRS